ncbi:MAG: non-heme iron oxygenase ferredoxin subunit [Anaerolineae bacterium]|nr:non-heme iron oxygenase ferredoxin subunit [Anaerolineae bacterium]
MTEFVSIATTDEIPPGERLVVEYGRKWVAIFNVNGSFYAIEDRCPHDDGPLADGILNDCTIECPRHGASFDITSGKVLSAPALVDVPTFQVRIENGSIQIAPR